MLAQGAFDRLALSWRPDEQVVAALSKISHAQTPKLLRHPFPSGVDLLNVLFDIGAIGERGFSGDHRKGVNIIGAGDTTEPAHHFRLTNGKAQAQRGQARRLGQGLKHHNIVQFKGGRQNRLLREIRI